MIAAYRCRKHPAKPETIKRCVLVVIAKRMRVACVLVVQVTDNTLIATVLDDDGRHKDALGQVLYHCCHI